MSSWIGSVRKISQGIEGASHTCVDAGLRQPCGKMFLEASDKSQVVAQTPAAGSQTKTGGSKGASWRRQLSESTE